MTKLARGYSDGKKGRLKVAIEFSEETFKKIRKRAEKEKTSFSKMAVKLIECGLFDYEDSERHEPETDANVGRAN